MDIHPHMSFLHFCKIHILLLLLCLLSLLLSFIAVFLLNSKADCFIHQRVIEGFLPDKVGCIDLWSEFQLTRTLLLLVRSDAEIERSNHHQCLLQIIKHVGAIFLCTYLLKCCLLEFIHGDEER